MFAQRKGLIMGVFRLIHSESQFLQVWRQVSNDLLLKLERDYADHPKVEDVEGNDQLLKITLQDGKTFVINRQTAKREIWYSSPISGPSHFRFDQASSQWINKNDEELYKLIEDDIGSVLK